MICQDRLHCYPPNAALGSAGISAEKHVPPCFASNLEPEPQTAQTVSCSAESEPILWRKNITFLGNGVVVVADDVHICAAVTS
jgi:hypothetical protein